jgi:Protein of unknown function (DUF2795)
MDRASSKHSPRLDEALQQETESLTRAGQPAHTEEWHQTEPAEPGHLDLPPDHQPAAPAGMTRQDVDRRSDIARCLPARTFPADRRALLDHLQRTGAPDEVIDAIRGLPADREFATVGEVVRALGIATED